jgi:hypothetical protein
MRRWGSRDHDCGCALDRGLGILGRFGPQLGGDLPAAVGVRLDEDEALDSRGVAQDAGVDGPHAPCTDDGHLHRKAPDNRNNVVSFACTPTEQSMAALHLG